MNAESFWAKVKRGDEDECWIWESKSALVRLVEMDSVPISVYRAAYILTYGDPNKGYVKHKCGNIKCCNPSHLYTSQCGNYVYESQKQGITTEPKVNFTFRCEQSFKDTILAITAKNNKSVAYMFKYLFDWYNRTKNQ